MKKQIILSLAFLLFGFINLATAQKDVIQVFKNAQIYKTDGTYDKNATLIVNDGKIIKLGKDLKIPEGSKAIDLDGKFIYPAFVNAYSALGISEVFAVWQTIDGGEKEEINPNIKVELAFNAESAHVPVTRANGIAYSVSVPMSGIIPGSSALMKFEGWNWGEMLKKAPLSLIINWPTSASMTAFGAGPSLGGQSKVDMLYEFFDKSKAYLKGIEAGMELKHDLRLEAMMPVLKGEIPVWVTANRAADIQSVLSFADHFKLKIAIVGGLESLRFTNVLKEEKIPIIVPNVFGIPDRTVPEFDAYFSLPAKLYEAGIKFCISVGGNMEVRNLPWHAAKASSYGLPQNEAIKAITQYPADIIRVGAEIGSIEVGKNASFIICDGNPLEISSQVLQMFIEGKEVSLENKHKALYEKFKTRYEQK